MFKPAIIKIINIYLQIDMWHCIYFSKIIICIFKITHFLDSKTNLERARWQQRIRTGLTEGESVARVEERRQSRFQDI